MRQADSRSGLTVSFPQPLTTILAQIKKEVFAEGYVQIDETPVKYQDPEREGTCGTGYLWVAHNPRVRKVSLFEWRTGRSTACLENLVPADYTGLIQCDGYQAYESFIKSAARSGSIQLAGCLAHMRRKFFEARIEGEDAQWVLAQVQQLYRIEAHLREARAGPLERRRTRQQDNAPILARIKSRLETLQASHKHRPRSLTGEAIRYALKQWDKLTPPIHSISACLSRRQGRRPRCRVPIAHAGVLLWPGPLCRSFSQEPVTDYRFAAALRFWM